MSHVIKMFPASDGSIHTPSTASIRSRFYTMLAGEANYAKAACDTFVADLITIFQNILLLH